MHSFPEELPKIGQVVRFVFKDKEGIIVMEAAVKARAHEETPEGRVYFLFALSTTTEQALVFHRDSWKIRVTSRRARRLKHIKIERPEIIQ